jgi:hypothetical protein
VLIFLIRWGFPHQHRPFADPRSATPEAFVSRQWSGSWGTTELVLDDISVTVRGRGPFVLFVNWHADYSQIPRVRRVTRTSMEGLLLQGPDGTIAFSTPRAPEILDLLELWNVPVDRTTAKLRRQDLDRPSVGHQTEQ